MKCPKCNSDFEQLQTPFGDVERCISCKGLWVDMAEHEELKNIADTVDIGDESRGKELNHVDHINCPVCSNNKMLRMVDPAQPHIWFESCPTCYGRFYDAGEFKDLADKSIGDFFKLFTAKERK